MQVCIALGWLRTIFVPLVAACVAILSFFVCPSSHWWQSIDWQTLNLLFCLMFVVAGLRACNLFRVLAQILLVGKQSFRALAHTLVQLSFWVSMIVTNDVALIVLVPFAIYVLDRQALRHRLPSVIVLQTVAANLGSMATPIGNPQNLFLYTAYDIAPGAFFCVMLPMVLVGWVLLTIMTQVLQNEPTYVRFIHIQSLANPYKVLLYGLLFTLCVLTVFRLFSNTWLFFIVTGCALLFCRNALRAVDYGLLFTFVCFFIFSNNLGQISSCSNILERFLQKNTQATAVLTSQVISNVPAAILLTPFTLNWRGLLLGVNIGGFGTLIASLASLISFRLYATEKNARPWRYLLLFTLINVIFSIVLTGFSLFGDLG